MDAYILYCIRVLMTQYWAEQVQVKTMSTLSYAVYIMTYGQAYLPKGLMCVLVQEDGFHPPQYPALSVAGRLHSPPVKLTQGPPSQPV